jgi:hypothetical protein
MWTEWKWSWSNRTIQNPVKSYQVFLPSLRALPHVTTMVVLKTVIIHMPWTVNLWKVMKYAISQGEMTFWNKTCQVRYMRWAFSLFLSLID